MNGFLSFEERETLRKQHRTERDRRVADRIKAVMLSDKGWSYRQIAEALMIDEQTISRHVEEYREISKLKPQNGGSESKVDALQTEAIKQHLAKKIYATTAEIRAYVKTTYGIDYTCAGMTSWLKNNGFSYKKPKPLPAKADATKQAVFVEYYEKLMTETPLDEPILFGDGVHPTMVTKAHYGWMLTGKDTPLKMTSARTRMNLFGALNLEQMKVTLASYETIDGAAMEDYLKKLKADYPRATKIHMILDQGPYNRCHKTVEAAEKLGIVLHYLPPYSPNLNPIERLWKVMNEQVRNNRFFETVKEFRAAVMAFFQETWPKIALSLRDRINDTFQHLPFSTSSV